MRRGVRTAAVVGIRRARVGTRLTRSRLLLVACAILVWSGVATGLTVAAPRYSDWSTPVNLGPTVNTAAVESSSVLSKNGLSLYFTRGQPGGLGGVGTDIYVSKRDSVDDPWGLPVNLGPTVNSAAEDQVQALSRDGHWIFLASTRRGGFGGNDIWASYREHTHDDFDWQAPVNLGANVNTASGENTAGYFENDGGAPQLYFNSNKPGGLGSTDIYLSELQPDGTWGPATNLSALNRPGGDAGPFITPDGLAIYFFSARAGGVGTAQGLWMSTREAVDAPWSTPMNLGTPVNSGAGEQFPKLSDDGETLYFTSLRPGGFGDRDLWMTTRSKAHGKSGS